MRCFGLHVVELSADLHTEEGTAYTHTHTGMYFLTGCVWDLRTPSTRPGTHTHTHAHAVVGGQPAGELHLSYITTREEPGLFYLSLLPFALPAPKAEPVVFFPPSFFSIDPTGDLHEVLYASSQLFPITNADYRDRFS